MAQKHVSINISITIPNNCCLDHGWVLLVAMVVVVVVVVVVTVVILIIYW